MKRGTIKRVQFTQKARVKFPVEEELTRDVRKLKESRKSKLKPVPFKKKHNVVHKVENPNADKKLELIKKAAELRGEIFTNLHCPKCWENGDHNINTVPHHILHKGSYDRLRFVLMNLVPLCNYHHGWNDNSERNFLQVWLLDNLPRHYRYYLNERDNRTPIQQTVESLTKIVEDLQHYADNPMVAEQVIYEKD